MPTALLCRPLAGSAACPQSPADRASEWVFKQAFGVVYIW